MALRDLAVRHGIPAWLALRSLPGLRGVLPDFVIIGAQKSGTTSLFNWIAGHPGVRRCLGQEVHYFDRHAGRGPVWYRAHFAHPLLARGKVTGEATPYYLFHPGVPQQAARLLPDTRFIAVLRDPVARAVSHYHHERRKGREPLDMLEAFRAEDARLAPELARLAQGGRSAVHQHHSYIARGRYAEQLERWFAAVGRDRVLVLKGEDLFAGSPEVTESLADFLALDPAGFGPPPRRNEGRYEEAPAEALDHLAGRFAEPGARLAALLGPSFRWESRP